MACGWHHHGPCWSSYPYPPPPSATWPPVREARPEDVTELREHLRRLEAEMAYVRDRIDEVSREQ